ncbi:MAG TPA: class I SAM-dependent methyltransferase [Candidatus Angelobacter sp.]|nr:class I SAM-dependent methyltransferase [Candidatus Angelobacter sp.]
MANQAEPSLRNISDTALWVAIYRARETERPDALFRDPFARKLAGARGEQIAQEMQLGSVMNGRM